MNLFAEFKRRNVIRMAGLYLVAAWLVVQVAGTVLPIFGAPEWIARTVVMLLAIGFLPALAFAWAFELTPQGLKRDADVPPQESSAPRTARRMDRLLLAVSVLAVAYFAFDKFVLAPRREATLVTQTTERINAHTEQPKTNPHSIAVLPFINMSGNADNEYFSDGITEEILNVLARTPGLQVAARTSSFAFKDDHKEVPEIARELNVRMVMEGSVRRQGERVRITAQLIDAGTGYHLWSQTYDRDLQDVFAIQDQIANAIAGELKLQLEDPTPETAPRKGTRNVEAHDRYLRGLALWQTRGETNLWQALEQFKGAAAADPRFAEAYAGMALDYVVLPDYSARITYEDSHRLARDTAERALGLDPTLPEPYVALGYLADADRTRRSTAHTLYQRAIALGPSFATAYQWLGNSLWASGQLEQGVAELEHASLLDPQSPIIANNHAMALIALGRYPQAIALCDPILEKAADNGPCLESTAFATLLLGGPSEAEPLLDRYADAINPGARQEVKELVDALQGRGDRHAIAARLAAFGRQSGHDPESGNVFEPYVITTLLVMLGEPQLALSYLQSFAYTDRAGMSEWAVMMPALGALHCDPGFVALVESIHTTDPHFAELCTAQS